MIKIISILLMLSVCLGSFSYIETRKMIVGKLNSLEDAVSSITGLMGIENDFRVHGTTNDFRDTQVYVNGEYTPLYSAMRNRAGLYSDLELEYQPDLTIDSIYPQLYEATFSIVYDNDEITGARNDTIVTYTMPCVRFVSGNDEVILVDPYGESATYAGINPQGITFDVRISEGLFADWVKTPYLKVDEKGYMPYPIGNKYVGGKIFRLYNGDRIQVTLHRTQYSVVDYMNKYQNGMGYIPKPFITDLYTGRS